MRPLAMAVLGAAAYAVFLVATVPAHLVAARMQARSNGAIRFTEVSGTLWKGKAHAVVTTPGGALALDRLDWRFRPARLLTGRAAFFVNAGTPGFEVSGEIARSPGAWHLRDLDAHGEVPVLAPLLPGISTWRPEGTAQVSAPALAWDGSEARGELRIEWRGAGLALADVRPLGTYRAEVTGSGGPMTMTLTTVEGALRLAGKGTLAAPGRIEFSGDARAEGANAKALEPLLNLLGPRRADGSRALDWRPR